MKNIFWLIIVGTLLYSIHHAEAVEVMVMQYNEQVRIVLSKEKCDKGEGFKAVAQRIDQEVMLACWTPKGKLIHIQWEGGDFSEFDVNRFYPVEI